MPDIPLIDISPLTGSNRRLKNGVAKQLGDACHEIGFVTVRGHGIPAARIESLRDAVARFFEQPQDYKLRWSISKENYRGYIPLGFFTPNAAGKVADAYEGFKLHCETDLSDPVCTECSLYGPNKWPDALTILAPDPVGGLQIKCRGDGEWISIDAPDDALIINIGDLLEVWSGGYFVSTPHKVVNHSGRERYSFPYFAVPQHDVRVVPLRPLQPGFEYIEIPVGEVSRDIWYSNWPDAAAIDARYDPAVR